MTDQKRRALVALLRRGEILPAEAAELAGVSRQAVHNWCTSAGIDWRAARRDRLMRLAMKIERWRR